MNKFQLEIPNHFETAHLVIRRYELDDGIMYFNVGQKNHKHLQRFEANNIILSAKTPEEAETIIRNITVEWNERNSFFMGAIDKTTLQAHRVRLHTSDTNLPSQRVAERCGFKLEGHIRQNKRDPDGTLSGDLYYRLLKSEYNAS